MPRLGFVGKITYFVAVLADAGTALVLIATLASSPARRSTIALSFAVGAVLMLATLLVLPLVPAEPAVIAAPVQTGMWLLVLWRVNVAVGAVNRQRI
jgi:hypothetical protein